MCSRRHRQTDSQHSICVCTWLFSFFFAFVVVARLFACLVWPGLANHNSWLAAWLGIKHNSNNILKHTRYEPWERRSLDDNVVVVFVFCFALLLLLVLLLLLFFHRFVLICLLLFVYLLVCVYASVLCNFFRLVVAVWPLFG